MSKYFSDYLTMFFMIQLIEKHAREYGVDPVDASCAMRDILSMMRDKGSKCPQQYIDRAEDILSDFESNHCAEIEDLNDEAKSLYHEDFASFNA